jgi:hypothetical protein
LRFDAGTDLRQPLLTRRAARKPQQWKKRGNDYILPVKVDGTELDGLLPTIGYVPIETGIDRIGQMLIQKTSVR